MRDREIEGERKKRERETENTSMRMQAQTQKRRRICGGGRILRRKNNKCNQDPHVAQRAPKKRFYA